MENTPLAETTTWGPTWGKLTWRDRLDVLTWPDGRREAHFFLRGRVLFVVPLPYRGRPLPFGGTPPIQ